MSYWRSTSRARTPPPSPTDASLWVRAEKRSSPLKGTTSRCSVLESLGSEQREVFLERACANDPSLRREVESLIRSSENAGSFIADAVERVKQGAPPEEAAAEGRRIGPYRILRLLGRGGMGAVYLAERADERYRKHVAIKLMRGRQDPDLCLRFRNEGQILATLDHPNIARLLDGGTTTANPTL